MKSKTIAILPLATALASLSGAASAHTAAVTSPELSPTPTDAQINTASVKPNVVFKAGEDLLGLLVTKGDNGMVVAQHASHYSHSSHASHASSRY